MDDDIANLLEARRKRSAALFGEGEKPIAALDPARPSGSERHLASAEHDPWTAFSGFIENLLIQLTADRGLLEAFTGDPPTAELLAQACERGATHLSAVADRARKAGALRADASDEDVTHLLSALSLLGESAGSAAWQRSLRFVLDGLRATGVSVSP